MHGIAIGVGIDGDGGNAHLPRRLDDAAGDLAAVGDQDFLEHARSFPPVGRSFYGLCRRGSSRPRNLRRVQSLGIQILAAVAELELSCQLIAAEKPESLRKIAMGGTCHENPRRCRRRRRKAAGDHGGRPRRPARPARCWSRSRRPASATPTSSRCRAPIRKACSRRSSAMRAPASWSMSGQGVTSRQEGRPRHSALHAGMPRSARPACRARPISAPRSAPPRARA